MTAALCDVRTFLGIDDVPVPLPPGCGVRRGAGGRWAVTRRLHPPER